MILKWHVNATSIICINDSYDIAEDDQCQLRIQDQGPMPNVYMKTADSTYNLQI